MADLARINKQISQLGTILDRILTNPNNFGSIRHLTKQYDKAMVLLKKIGSLSTTAFEAEGIREIYNNAYNSIGKLFQGKTQLNYSPLPKSNNPAAVKTMQKEYDRAMKEMVKMAKFNMVERKTIHSEAYKALMNGIERTGGVKDTKEIARIAESIASKFSPASGVRKFRSEYYGIGEKDAGRKIFPKYWGKSWDDLSQSMSKTIQQGITSGQTAGQVNQKMIKKLSNHFPTERETKTIKGKVYKVKEPTFPIPVRQADGTMGVRKLGMNYYAQLKRQDYAVRTQSIATTTGMLNAGYDLVMYNIHGSQKHTDTCLDLSANGAGKIWSLSGKSKNYEQLWVFPPAHYGCASSIDPLPSDQQEQIEIPPNEVSKFEEKQAKAPLQKKESVTKEAAKTLAQQAIKPKKPTVKPKSEQLIKIIEDRKTALRSNK